LVLLREIKIVSSQRLTVRFESDSQIESMPDRFTDTGTSKI